MECFRCKKDLGHANISNADYVTNKDVLEETITEEITVIVAGKTAIEKSMKGETLVDSDFEETKVASLELARGIKNREKIVIVDTINQSVTPILICPDCYIKDADTVIWGIHKKNSIA